MQTTLTPAQRIEAYIKLRDYKKSAQDAFSKSLEKVNAAMEKLEMELLTALDASGADSLACPSGTVYKTMQLTATVQDREAFRLFVQSQGNWEALDVKANKTFVRAYIEESGNPVPGVKVSQIASVNVRRK